MDYKEKIMNKNLELNEYDESVLDDINSVTLSISDILSTSNDAQNTMNSVFGNLTSAGNLTSSSLLNANISVTTPTHLGANIFPHINTVYGNEYSDTIVNGNLIIKGKNVLDILQNIEDRLCLFVPNEKLEEKWEKLRDLRTQYMNLEKEILEKEKIMDILKK